jgi:hypothetical protein
MNHNKKRDWIDTRLHLPWRVKTPRDVTTGKRLFFYLFVFIWTGLTTEILGKGDIRIKWPWWGFLELQSAGSVGEGICAVL